MTTEDFKGTNLEKDKGLDEFQEVENLIKETLAESKILGKKEEKKEPAPALEVKATPLAPKAPQTEAEKYNATFKEYQVGDIVKGTVIKVDQGGVLVDIKYKADGFIAPEELSDLPFTSPSEMVKEGQLINVYIENLENKEGQIVLSKKHADYEYQWKKAFNAYKTRETLEGKVIQALRGGLVVDCDGLRGFVPASQVLKNNEASLDSFKGQVLPLKVIEVNRRQGKIVLSHKQAAGEHEKSLASKLFDELEVGQIRKGKVASLKSFGAFVDLGGVEGLVHLSELSWKRVKHPSELLKTGQELDVFVLGVDKINRKIALGLKELQDDPWDKATDHFKPGQIVKAKIARFAKFGAFAELDHDLEGLIHISEMCQDPIRTPDEAQYPDGTPIKIGDVVEVKVLRIIPEEQKIGLSIKAVIRQKEKEEVKKILPQEETIKVTIGDMIAAKEKERAELEDNEIEVNVVESASPGPTAEEPS